MDGIKFIEPSIHLFSFNNPFGACKNCDGFGETIGIDEELVIPNKGLSVYDDAIAPWRGTGLRKYYVKLIDNADKFDFPIYKPYNELSKEEFWDQAVAYWETLTSDLKEDRNKPDEESDTSEATETTAETAEGEAKTTADSDKKEGDKDDKKEKSDKKEDITKKTPAEKK